MKKWNDELIKTNRKILLLVDNFSGHKVEVLSNIHIEYLPPNTTSKIQPMDLGIIPNFKIIFRIIRNNNTYSKIKNLKMNECFEIAMEAMKQIKDATFWNCFKSSPVFTEVLSSQTFNQDPEQNITVEFVDNETVDDKKESTDGYYDKLDKSSKSVEQHFEKKEK